MLKKYADVVTIFWHMLKSHPLTMPRFWKADWKSKRKNYAQGKRIEHYRGLTVSQRSMLRKHLKQARLDNKMSQRQAGELLGQDQMFISKIESGMRQVEFIEVEHFAQIYRKPLSFFSTMRLTHSRAKTLRS